MEYRDACTVLDELVEGGFGGTLRVGILGGSFDPPHQGHLQAARRAHDELDLDLVMMMPASVSPFKQTSSPATSDIRRGLCALACTDESWLYPCDFELQSGGVSYTTDTLAYLSQRYGQAVSWYFIAGGDALVTMPSWKEGRGLTDYASIIGVIVEDRPLSPSDEQMLRECYGDKLHLISSDCWDVSSRAIRRRIQHDELPYLWLNLQVASCIEQFGLYRSSEHIGDVGCSDLLAGKMRRPEHLYAATEELRGRVSAKRYYHSLRVAHMAEVLAYQYGCVDPELAYSAGLLHDWDKGLTKQELLDKLERYDCGLDRQTATQMPWIIHGYSAAASLKQSFDWVDDAIAHAIAHHTTAAIEMSDLEKIIYVADLIEPGRKFPKAEELRKQIGHVSLDELYFSCFKHTYAYLVDQDALIFPKMGNIWNRLIDKRKQA